MTTTPTRPRWMLPAAVMGAALIAVAAWLFQPWLLWVDSEVNETLPTVIEDEDAMADDAAMDDDATDDEADAPDPMDGDQMAPDAEPTGPVVLASGTFTSRDHETVGTASLVQLEDGSRVVTLEDLRTSNGPDLYVYLDDDPADAEALAFDDGLDLGPLRGNVGDLVYAVPPDADLTGLDTVVIWCDRFSHVFGAADLTPA